MVDLPVIRFAETRLGKANLHRSTFARKQDDGGNGRYG